MEVTLDEVVALVRRWLSDSKHIAPDPTVFRLAGLLRDESGLAFTTSFVDGVIRPGDPAVAALALAKQAAHAPDFLDWRERGALRWGARVGTLAPQWVMPLTRWVLRRMLRHLVLDARPRPLARGLDRVASAGFVPNLSLMGEAVLGEQAARRHLRDLEQLVARSDVSNVAIKISSVLGPRAEWDFESAVADAVTRLTPLMLRAAQHDTFLTFDMEDYRHHDLTVAIFQQLLDQPELGQYSAGIAVQAYLPEALTVMQALQYWAAARVSSGGAPIKVRLVKGANLPTEQVTAELRGWPVPTCASKQATDTNYKRILDYALHPDHTAHVRVGITGHNLFDLAWAWLLAGRRQVREAVEIEMLLGMATAQADVIRRAVGRVLVYTPVVHPREFSVAIPYLVRRLEEAADQQNFMSAIFRLDELFERERGRFAASLLDLGDQAPAKPRRTQNRLVESPAPTSMGFRNTADTDSSLAQNRRWAQQIFERIPTCREGETQIAAARVSTVAELDQVLTRGQAASLGWATRNDCAAVLRQVAATLAQRRARLIEVAASECGKTLEQSDVEVSEAIDFANYYAVLADELNQVDGARFAPVALSVVAPPWNFPLAIPTGSTLAALAAGSAVVLKPAPQARCCGAVLAEAFWDAGVPRQVLQVVDVSEDELGQQLITDPRVECVVLTGAYETARRFRRWRPGLRLLAETSGKNAIVITPSADLELAVPDLVASAFSHAGQKCSAASLAITVGSVTTSSRFRELLVDAVTSLRVGPADDPATQVGPLIEPATGKLLAALTVLEPGQRWLVPPRQLDTAGRLWSPGVRTGVQRGSEFHHTEYFGPVLGLMHAATLDEAVQLQNDVPFGLTAGLHSLDTDEIAHWVDQVQAGNLYVNRGITGAVVQRQPFGGWKKSSVGAGAKAGGPNYLFGFGSWESQHAREGAPLFAVHEELWGVAHACAVADEQLARSWRSDALAWQQHFVPRDVAGLRAEQNVLRYRPARVLVRAGSSTRLADVIRVLGAGMLAEAQIWLSLASEPPIPLLNYVTAHDIECAVHSDEDWARKWVTETTGFERIRLLGGAGEDVWHQTAELPEFAVFDHPVTESGRVELLVFLREQAVSGTAHRFGQPQTRPPPT